MPLPLRLCDTDGLSNDDLTAVHHARSAWFTAHGIDPRALNETSVIVNESRAAHGLPDITALNRARLRAPGIFQMHSSAELVYSRTAQPGAA
jgi:hypothetical protein